MLNTLVNMCSHLKNSSRARLALTSIPSTKHTLALALALQQSGFLSTVIRGGKHPPPLLTSTSMPHATDEAQEAEAVVTQENIASRRLWVGLKYSKQYPVLTDVAMESKPKQRVTLKAADISAVIRGKQRNFVKGLTRTGECLYLLTDKGVKEARECEEERIGGLVLCRVV